MVEPKTTRILLLGETGSGKSSLANTIFGKKMFNVCRGFKSGTSVCEAKTKSVNGRKLTLIDLPGFFDKNITEEKLKPEILKCITECSPGPHAFLIVLKVEKITDQEEDVIQRITKRFSEEVYKFATVVFTHGHELPKQMIIKDLVKQNKSLGDFIEKCGGRCHVIDNKRWNKRLKCKYRSNKYQVGEILRSIKKTVETNNGNCYTNEMLQKVEKMIQQKEKNIAESSEKMSEKEIRTDAKNIVHTFLSKTSLDVGTLLGALLGAAALCFVLSKCSISGMILMVIKAAGEMAVAGTGGEKRAAGAGKEEEAVGAAGTGGEERAGGARAVGLLASIGAVFGGYDGHEAAKAAETPLEAAVAVCSNGMKTIEGVQNLKSLLDKFFK